MDQYELTRKLLDLKMKKGEFARRLGIHASTVYHWKETPRYVDSLLQALEDIEALRVELGRKE